VGYASRSESNNPNDKVIDTYCLVSNYCTTKTIDAINNGQDNAIIPSTTTVTQIAFSSPAQYDTQTSIISPKQLKNELDIVSKKRPQDIVRINDPEAFYKEMFNSYCQ